MSFAASLRAAIEVAPRADLGRLSTTIWKAWGSGSLSGDEAQALSELVAARKAIPGQEKPVQRRVGSQLAARFTMGEAAVLAVIAVEVRKHGACTLTIGHIAALAGVCRSTAKNALREAHALGVIRVTVRRLTAWRCDSNLVTVLDPAWLASTPASGGTVKSLPSTPYKRRRKARLRRKGLPRRGADGWSGAQRNCAVREAVALLRVTWRGSFKTRPPAKARRAGPSLWC